KDSIVAVQANSSVKLNSTVTQKALENLNLDFPIQEQAFKYASSEQAEFTFNSIYSEYPVSENINNKRGEAIGSFDEIESRNSWVTSVNNEDISTLPIGVKHYMNEVEYAIGIAKAR